jgi:hypothetical protein
LHKSAQVATLACEGAAGECRTDHGSRCPLATLWVDRMQAGIIRGLYISFSTDLLFYSS